MALLVIALSATQNRGGLLGATAGAAVGLAFLPSRDRLRLILRAVAVTALGLGLAVQLSLKIPAASGRSRAFSASQLIANVLSIGGAQLGSSALWRPVVTTVVTSYGHWSSTGR